MLQRSFPINPKTSRSGFLFMAKERTEVEYRNETTREMVNSFEELKQMITEKDDEIKAQLEFLSKNLIAVTKRSSNVLDEIPEEPIDNESVGKSSLHR